MDCQIRGKLAYVNAGAYGIGEAVADLLTREGASVIVGDKDEGVLREKAPRWTVTVAADLATVWAGLLRIGLAQAGAHLVLAKRPEETRLNWRCDAGHTHSTRK